VFEADGALSLAALTSHFPGALPETKASTVAGLLAELAGRIPRAGERFVIRTLEFDILSATAARVERVLVRQGPVTTQTLDRGTP